MVEQRTHCIRGHLWDETNTYTSPRGQQYCRQCHAENVARRYPSQHDLLRQKEQAQTQAKIDTFRAVQATYPKESPEWAVYQLVLGAFEPQTPTPDVSQGWFNRAKTHCPQGHPYDEENTYYSKEGRRVCRACRAAQQATLRQSKPSPLIQSDIRLYEKAVIRLEEQLCAEPENEAVQNGLQAYREHLASARARAHSTTTKEPSK